MNFFWTDKHGNKCAAKAMFSIGCLVVFAKLLFSGLSIGDFDFGETDVTDMAALLGVLGGAYWGRSNTKAQHEGK